MTHLSAFFQNPPKYLCECVYVHIYNYTHTNMGVFAVGMNFSSEY